MSGEAVTSNLGVSGALFDTLKIPFDSLGHSVIFIPSSSAIVKDTLAALN